MKKIVFVFVGKSKDTAMRDLENHYLKKIAFFFPAELIITKDVKTDTTERKKRETRLIMEHIKPGDTIVLCDENGKTQTSPGLAKKLDHWRQTGKRVVVIVGGAYGVAMDLLPKNTEIISLSSLTFPHELARVVVLEQIYRACTILKKTGYHHV